MACSAAIRVLCGDTEGTILGVQAGRGSVFGDLLRDHRLAAGLTQEELAGLCGLSIRAVADMERGRTASPIGSAAG
jgi:predicted transcriptional regulator